MKILTKEEEQEHYNATLKGGLLGGAVGLGIGALGVVGASSRYPAFRSLTLPLRAFLITSSGTFASIVTADHYSRSYESSRHPEEQYRDEQQSLQDQLNAQKSTRQRTLEWLNTNRYKVVFGSWVASMGTALGLVGRNPYLSTQQKLVQARVYAQGLTIAVVIISLAFETTDRSQNAGRWETVKVIDPEDPEHKHVIEKKIHHERYAGEDQWRDMVEAEEQRIKQREAAVRERLLKDKKSGKKEAHPEKHSDEEAEKGKPEESKSRSVKAP
ncbi:mitochondrial hypoxia responsive domain protein [Teratosphaeria destructans]|uniref:Mitochondrial hypoxia responsive domain protein n=1 Tax=Teratosphaeria destructans TaxID=418781 RepID=A0A9W7SZ85_9PEZI|nr:mitochondrial hypoxia responsive domain protein [Teratosphaeria destructans]